VETDPIVPFKYPELSAPAPPPPTVTVYEVPVTPKSVAVRYPPAPPPPQKYAPPPPPPPEIVKYSTVGVDPCVVTLNVSLALNT
jgi:hypothetical protein